MTIDVMLLIPEWQPRALIRAQLIEEGLEVFAANTWPSAKRNLIRGVTPRVIIVDLKGLPGPASVLEDLRAWIDPHRVLVLTAAGTVPVADIDRLGFRVMSRPIVIKDLVRRAAAEGVRGIG